MSKIGQIIFDIQEMLDQDYTKQEICEILNVPYHTIEEIEDHFFNFDEHEEY